MLWCVTRPDLFAPALSQAGLKSDRVIYLEGGDDKTVLACFEEGLRHGGLGAVVAEVARLPMTASRRLQLAAEGSGTLGIALRRWRRQTEASDFGQPTAATSRWRVSALPSTPLPVPGVGQPRWLVELIRCRAGELAKEGQAAPLNEPGVSGHIFVSVEMSRSKWMIGLHSPLADKISLHTVACGDVDGVLELVRRVSARLEGAGDSRSTVIVCYEAEYEGFWLHRRLNALSIRVVVIDPASLLVDRRAKRAKTDRIDARSMIRALMAFARGEQRVLSEVHVPTVEQDDARRTLRERQRLVQERTAHTNRVKGLLKTQGVMDFDPRAADAAARLDKIVTGDGRPLGICLKREIVRELERLALAMKQISQIEAERDAVVEEGRQGEDTAAGQKLDATMIAILNRLKGIGANDATLLVREAFWRDFRNRRELGGWSGFAPSPWASGSVSRDQGITKAGPPMLRAHMIQIAWRWLFWQPGSDLSKWFQRRTNGTTGRVRRIMVVALARKLLIALWRYATAGIIPNGAIVT